MGFNPFKKLAERRRAKKTSRALDTLYTALLEHLERGGQLEDLTAYVVETPVWWSQADQTWKMTCQTSTLSSGDRIYFAPGFGRGGADEFANLSSAGLERGVLEFEYAVEFGANSRAGLSSLGGLGLGTV